MTEHLAPIHTACPTDLLAGRGMERIHNELSRIADLIIYDTPAALAVPDVLEIGRLVEGAVLVLLHRESTRREVSATVERLETLGIPVVGTVLNGIDTRSDAYYHYYSYYYQSGYATDDDPAWKPSRRQQRRERRRARRDGRAASSDGRGRTDDDRNDGRSDGRGAGRRGLSRRERRRQLRDESRSERTERAERRARNDRQVRRQGPGDGNSGGHFIPDAPRRPQN